MSTTRQCKGLLSPEVVSDQSVTYDIDALHHGK